MTAKSVLFEPLFECLFRRFHFYAKPLLIPIQWGGGITGHLHFTPVMSHESEVQRFCTFKIKILAELVYLIIFCLFLLFKTYWGRRYGNIKPVWLTYFGQIYVIRILNSVTFRFRCIYNVIVKGLRKPIFQLWHTAL